MRRRKRNALCPKGPGNSSRGDQVHVCKIPRIRIPIRNVCEEDFVIDSKGWLLVGLPPTSSHMPQTGTDPLLTEKRRSMRIPVKVRAHYRSAMVSMEGWVANLSRCGLFLNTDLLDSEGSTAVLELILPGVHGSVDVPCEVVRVDLEPGCSGMGIRFHDMNVATQRMLANFMIERSYQAPADA